MNDTDHTRLTVLADGRTLHHHPQHVCKGGCCLHDSSPYAGCAYPKYWGAMQIGALDSLWHECPCGVLHPCMASIMYRHHRYVHVPHTCCLVAGHCGPIEGEVVTEPEKPKVTAVRPPALLALPAALEPITALPASSGQTLAEAVDERLAAYADTLHGYSATIDGFAADVDGFAVLITDTNDRIGDVERRIHTVVALSFAWLVVLAGIFALMLWK